MLKGNHLDLILRSIKTVFSSEDLALLWHEPVTNATRVRINYYIQKGALYHIRNGLYAKDEKYARLELATRIFTPSYVSFETVLAKEGLIFQYYEKITVASYLTREVIVDQQTYSYRKLKNKLLVNPLGVTQVDGTSLATKERAMLDTLYLNANYHFDNLESINWEKVLEILPAYTNNRLEKEISRISKKGIYL